MPDHLERAEYQQRKSGSHGQRHQGLDVAAGQHAVEHLEHVKRRDQHQQIEEQAKCGDHRQPAPHLAQSVRSKAVGCLCSPMGRLV